MTERKPHSDDLIGQTEEAEATQGGGRALAAANLFDLRRIIGGLFVLYGIVLTILGIGDSQAEVDKAAGVRINLWMGLGMLALGILFLIWAFTRPLGEQLAEGEDDDEPREGTDHPVPRAVDTQSLESDEPRGRTGGDREGARRAGDPGRE